MDREEQQLHRRMQAERRHLVSLAYRALGNLARTERAVQATYLRWYGRSAAEQESTRDTRRWLTDALALECQRVLDTAPDEEGALAVQADAVRRPTCLGPTHRARSADGDRVVRGLIRAARDRDEARVRALLGPAVGMSAAGGPAAVEPAIGAAEVSRRLLRPLRAHPQTTVLAQHTPRGLGFAFWEDACLLGVGTVEVVDGFAGVVRLDANPRRIARWT